MKREVLIDARDLDPPEPMERVFAALDSLRHGEYVRCLLPREPLPLYPLLRQQGYRYQTRVLEGNGYEILIYPLGS